MTGIYVCLNRGNVDFKAQQVSYFAFLSFDLIIFHKFVKVKTTKISLYHSESVVFELIMVAIY